MGIMRTMTACSSRRVTNLAVTILLLVSSISTQTSAYMSRQDRTHKHPEVFEFPYIGRGDPDHSFLHPYTPGPGGDPINGWFQLGSATVSRSRSGRDVVRLTGAGQGNQGILYNAIKTETNNWNGYVDIEIESVRESHEAADGMGLFFVRERPELGSAMGITERYQGLGIIIDTFSNSRTKHVPYLYAYVSEGTKGWNPDSDGADTELTRGCQLEMDTKIRIYIQYIDEELHVGVSMNSKTPHRWHTCFKASNVKLPFSDGGYFAFAGETGHFYALHEVHDAAFVDESAHSGQNYYSDYHQQEYGAESHGHQEQQQQHQHNDHPQHEHQQQEQHYDHSQHEQQQQQTQQQAQQQQQQPKNNPSTIIGDRSDPAMRVHKGNTAEESLSGSLDLQVYEIFNSMTSALRGLHDKDSEEAKLRLNGVRDVTGHLIKEMEKQRAEMSSIVQLLKHLKESSSGLSYDSDKFSKQLKSLHGQLTRLRHDTEELASGNDDVHAQLVDHHEDMLGRKGGSGIVVLFFVVQLLLVAGFVASRKVGAAMKKSGRMV